ncbi:MAG: phosphate ABC transporter permease PstA [Tissierellia bacterium]|nr:phosphate ABC transporter permease PstA [Tissierellia bacterium]
MKKTFKPLIMVLSAIGFFAFLSVIVYILVNGIPSIDSSLFEFKYTSENHSIIAPLLTTLVTIVITLLIALPIGIFTAIYTTQYAKNKKVVKAVSFTTEILAAIPSIVYGLFGYLSFVIFFKMEFSIIAGCMTLMIMVLPTIIRTSEEAILSVNTLQRDASLALGASKLTTIFKIIIPEALPGILAGVFLATGRIVGETAALMYTMGTYVAPPSSLSTSSRTLAVHMFMLSSEGLYVDKAYATAVILLVFVILVNAISNQLAKKIIKEN